MSRTSAFDTLFHDRLHAASRRLLWSGLAILLLGVAALVFPSVTTLTVTFFVGWVLIIFGALALTASFSIHGTGPFFAALLSGLLTIAGGLFLVFNPVAGEAALTLLLGLLFMFQGAFELSLALEARPLRGWTGMLISALASIVLAVLIVIGWPAISVVALGLLLGVNLITSGIGYVLLAQAVKGG